MTNQINTTPHGCWDCKHAEIDGDRPAAFKPGMTYRVRCPMQAGAAATSTMTADQGFELPICSIGQWTALDGQANAVSLVTNLVAWLIRWNRLSEVDGVLEAQLPGRERPFHIMVIENALRFGVASGEIEKHWANTARRLLLRTDEAVA